MASRVISTVSGVAVRRANALVLRVAALVSLAFLTAFGAVACGQDPAAFDREAAVTSFSNTNAEATTVQSECVVDRLIDRYGLERLETELRSDPPKADFAESQFRDMFACGIEGDVRDQIVQQLQANEVAEADAPCVADVLMADLDDDDFDVLLSGDITDSFFAKFVSAMEDCGAINS